jgi:DNA-binding CsgD family transcriptional regulator
MMLQRATLDDRLGDAVARLTAKERECLERWLSHATAKEIALDLGITHHAVEKRLKSARAKLGVATTLDAARLLAAVEGYGPTVSQPPEVFAATHSSQKVAPAAPLPFWRGRHRKRIVTGVSLMSLVILAAVAFSAQSQPDRATALPERKVVVLNRKDGASVDLSSALASAFGSMDKNKDKFIAGDELGNSKFQVLRTTTRAGETPPAPAVTSLANSTPTATSACPKPNSRLASQA